tara:strand:+ start:96 stop:410 length:315 start_codon:yes stop_codon:yes gene_type:complete
MITGNYSAEGTKGLLGEGGSSRLDQAKALIENLGGTLECMYFAYGETDIVGICEMPDSATAAAATLAVSSSGAVDISLTPLITAEEIDAAAEKARGIAYRPPGS